MATYMKSWTILSKSKQIDFLNSVLIQLIELYNYKIQGNGINDFVP